MTAPLMNIEEFERLVEDAVLALPEHLRTRLDNVGFVVEERARRAKEHEVGIMLDECLLGLYEGVSHLERGADYFGVLPDKITIFREPHEAMARDEGLDLAEFVRETVWHEIGHHLGFDDDEIHAIEERRRERRSGVATDPGHGNT